MEKPRWIKLRYSLGGRLKINNGNLGELNWDAGFRRVIKHAWKILGELKWILYSYINEVSKSIKQLTWQITGSMHNSWSYLSSVKPLKIRGNPKVSRWPLRLITWLSSEPCWGICTCRCLGLPLSGKEMITEETRHDQTTFLRISTGHWSTIT
jgi:hypothetical protein